MCFVVSELLGMDWENINNPLLSLPLFTDKSVLCNALSDIKFFELEQHKQVG